MAAPLLVPIAVAIARAVAAQAAKQGVKQISKSQTKRITAKVIAKSGGRNKVSSVQARRIAEEAAGPKARRLGGTAALRSTKPKPDVRVTTRTSRGTTVTKPIKRETNKKGSAITVKKIEPRKAADVRAERAKARRARLRDALTPRVNPARPKVAPKKGSTGSTRNDSREQELIDRYYKVRFGDRGGPTPRSAQDKQPSIESRIASGAEKPTRGKGPSTFDKEAEARINAGLRNRKPGDSNLDLGTGKRADLPNSKAIGEAARKRPGLRKRKEASIQQSRTSANAAMTKRGMTPAEKKTAVMKARAKARKIAKNTGAQ